MNRKLNTLITIFMVIAFLTSATPMLAASSDKKESTKKTTSSKSTTSKDTKKKSSTKKATTPFKGTVNINKATKKELMQLPGIGEVKAAEIIKTRKKMGNFKKADDLLKVNGIGDQTLKGIKKHLKF